MGMEFVRDESLDAQSIRQFVECAGILNRAADVLVQVIQEPDFLGRALGRQRDCSNDGDFVRSFVAGAAECFIFENPDASLLNLFLVLSGYRQADWWTNLIPASRLKNSTDAAFGPLARANWASKLLAGINLLGPALLEVWTPESSKMLIKFAGVLSDRLDAAQMQIPAAIDPKTTLLGLQKPELNIPPSPATPLFWYLAFNQRGIMRFDGRQPPSNILTEQILDLADSATDDDMGTLYMAVIDALIECTRKSPIQDPMDNVILGFLTGGNHLPILSTRKIVLEHFPMLSARIRESGNNRLLLLPWLKTGAWVTTRLPDAPLLGSNNALTEGTLTLDSPGELGTNALELVTRADLIVGTSRKSLREGQQIDWPAVDYSIKLLNYLGSPWRALRAVTLMFMVSQEACTGPDLRWWSEDGHPEPPKPWSQLAQWYSWLILWSDAHAEQDPEFKRGREDFSQFLLDRLKDIPEGEKSPEQKGKRVPVESRPEWRIAICESAIALRANPKGRGDHILYQVMKHDPDEHVRNAAENAYSKVRYYKGDTGGLVARSLFMKVFWWLRQAQRLSLGLEIDASGAQRTRNKELDRNAVNQWV